MVFETALGSSDSLATKEFDYSSMRLIGLYNVSLAVVSFVLWDRKARMQSSSVATCILPDAAAWIPLPFSLPFCFQAAYDPFETVYTMSEYQRFVLFWSPLAGRLQYRRYATAATIVASHCSL